MPIGEVPFGGIGADMVFDSRSSLGDPSVGGTARRKTPIMLAVFVCVFMYAFDLSTVRFVPPIASSYTVNFAVPFDLMVCVPLVFYFLVVRRRGMTPLAVLPVIYLGGLVSSFVVVPGSPTALPVLFGIAIIVDGLVLAHEVPRVVKAFCSGYREAHREGTYPIEWFVGAFEAIVPSRAVARAAAMEAAMWYHLLFSWRRVAQPPRDAKAFTCHKNSGFVPLVGVVVALGFVEVIVVHLLVSRYSLVAAALFSAFSVYGLAWLASCARAVVTSPILLDGSSLTAAWGFLQCERIPVGSIERVSFSDLGLGKRATLDMATMGAKPCWVVLKEPRKVDGIFGSTREVRAIKLAPDDLHGFAGHIGRLIEDGK